MKTFTSSHPAEYGVYVSANPPDVCFVGSDGDVLEGRPGAQYVHLPTLLVLALSPAFGAAFVLLFPVFIVAGVAMALSAFVSERVNGFAGEHAYLVRMGWEPATAYLNKKNTKDADATAPKDATLEGLEKEVAARRHEDSNKQA